jgi:hypothetical protein
LQEVLRARREAPSLLSPEEAAQREASRRRDEEAAAAADALLRWREGRAPDADGKLAPGAYRTLHRLDPAAYEASRHWARRVKAQYALAPTCEVERCSSGVGIAVHHLTHETVGREEPGRDLITLCDGCHRRAQKLGRELGRVPRRPEIVALDPRRPLYDAAEIAALKAKYRS